MPGERARVCVRGVLAAGTIVIGGMFVYVGLAKVMEHADFVRAIEGHGLLPSWALGPAGVVVPAIEVTIGAAIVYLTIVRQARLASRIGSIMFSCLTLYCTVLVAHPPPEPSPCGCGLHHAPITDWTPLAAGDLAASIALFLVGYFLPRVKGGPLGLPGLRMGLGEVPRVAGSSADAPTGVGG